MAISILTGGRGAGKTQALLSAAILEAMTHPNRGIAFITSNNYQQAHIKNQIVETIKGLGQLRSVENTVVNFRNGSRIHVFETIAARHVPALPGLSHVYADEPTPAAQKIIENVDRQRRVDILVAIRDDG